MPSAYCPVTVQRLPPPEMRIVSASRVTWQLVTTIEGATVTPLPMESPPCWRSASTRTTLADTETKGGGLKRLCGGNGTLQQRSRE